MRRLVFKVDLHTHSTASHDGGIKPAQYKQVLESGLLDCVAITDHGRIDIAQQLHDELGDKIIIGEEIMSQQGEIIGLYLDKPVMAGLSAHETIQVIRDQGGIVYIPHPFETVRKGLHPEVLEELEIDILEVCNGRAFAQNRSQQAVVWARLNHVSGAAASDAHGIKGLGKTYTLLAEVPTRTTLQTQMRQARVITERPALRSLLYPKYHRLRKKVLRK